MFTNAQLAPHRGTSRRWPWLMFYFALALAVMGEIGVRIGGLVDFPLYDANARIGYIPRAEQGGRFLNRNEWMVNSKHMSAGPFEPGPAGNVLVIGDSIVWGGNLYARSDRLGPKLQALLPQKVWPIAAGSWALQNELVYLIENPDVVKSVETIVFVLNSGDFGEPSAWSCSHFHPLEPPRVALWYLAKKYVLKTPCEGTPPTLAVTTRDPMAMLQAFVEGHARHRFVALLYPDLEELMDDALLRARLEMHADALTRVGVAEVVSVARDPRWAGHRELYRDGIHPTPAGMGVLASVIASTLQRR